jgi:hypothetical protein
MFGQMEDRLGRNLEEQVIGLATFLPIAQKEEQVLKIPTIHQN